MSQDVIICPYCKGCGMANPAQPQANDVHDIRAGRYKERHKCGACKGFGEPNPSNQLDPATGKFDRARVI